MYIKNYKRIALILAFFLLYISMYLIHNAYGALCIIKSNSGDKGNINSSSKGDIEPSKLFKANVSNLFVSNVHNCWLAVATFRYAQSTRLSRALEGKKTRNIKLEEIMFRFMTISKCLLFFIICSRELIYDSKSV